MFEKYFIGLQYLDLILQEFYAASLKCMFYEYPRPEKI